MSAPADSAPLEPGQSCGPYRVTALLGAGGFGEVYAAVGPDGRSCAVKRLRLGSDRKAAKRALLEAVLLRSIAHPNVVEYRDSGVAEGRVWLATELLAGQSLRELARQTGPMPATRALWLGRQMCAGLGAAHRLGAVHRDMKPENVLVLPGDVVKVIDFGIAKATEVDMRTTQVVGTPLYMAPDLLNPALSLASPDPRWDVYATAMIIYELLLGAHPLLVGETEPPPAALVIAWQLTRPIPPACGLVPGVSLLTAAALARALEKDPRQRFESMALFEAVLDECLRRELASESVAAGTPPAVGPAADLAAASAALGAPPARAPRRWLPRDDGDWLALAIGAAIGLGLGLWWWGPWGAP